MAGPRKTVEALLILPTVAGIALAFFIAFAALVLVARLLVLAWLWLLLPLGMPELPNNALAIVLAGATAAAAWAVFRRLQREASPLRRS